MPTYTIFLKQNIFNLDCFQNEPGDDTVTDFADHKAATHSKSRYITPSAGCS